MSRPRPSAVQATGGTVDLALPIVNGVAAHVPAAGVAALEANPTLLVVPDATVQPTGASFRPVSSRSGSSSAPSVDTQISAIDRPPGWSPDAGHGVAVALVDTGVTSTPDLHGDRLVRGPDFSGEGDGIDHYGHGTFMAGLIAGDGTASAERGAAPLRRRARRHDRLGQGRGRRRLDDRFARSSPASAGSSPTATAYDIDVLNLSFGVDAPMPYFFNPLSAAAEAAWASGITVVVSAGNDGDGHVTSPGSDPYVITVGAADTGGTAATDNDVVPSWSGRERFDGYSKPDVVAPGVSVVSLRAPGSTIDVTHPEGRVDDTYFRGTGTSMSTAMVSGAAAVLLASHPAATPDDVKGALVDGAARISAGAREVDLARADEADARADWWQHFPVAFHGLGRGFENGMPWTASRWTASRAGPRRAGRRPAGPARAGPTKSGRPSRWTGDPLDREPRGRQHAGRESDGRRRHGRRRAGGDPGPGPATAAPRAPRRRAHRRAARWSRRASASSPHSRGYAVRANRGSVATLALAFALTGFFAMSLEFHRHRFTFTLAEAVLAVGFFAVGPIGLAVAAALGECVNMVVQRHSPLKVAFNVSNRLAATTAAGIAFAALGNTNVHDATAWGAALGAALCFSILDVVSTAAVLSIVEETRFHNVFVRSAIAGLLATLTSAPIGLVALALAEHGPFVPLLLAPIAAAVALNAGYAVAQRDEHLRFERLYESSARTASLVAFDDALRSLAAETRSLGTGVAALCCATGADGEWRGAYADDDGERLADAGRGRRRGRAHGTGRRSRGRRDPRGRGRATGSRGAQCGRRCRRSTRTTAASCCSYSATGPRTPVPAPRAASRRSSRSRTTPRSSCRTRCCTRSARSPSPARST